MATKSGCGQSGFALFGAMLIVPLILTVGLAVIDLSGWNSLRTSLQLAADQISYQGASALPDRQAVIAAVSAAASRLSIPGLKADVIFSPGKDLEVSIRLKARYRGSALAMLGVFDQSLTVEREGRAAVVPKDVLIILGLGSTLRPVPWPRNPSEFSAWGSISEWPRSGYYDCALAPRVADASIWPEWSKWSDPMFQRWATESCFNPNLSAVKLTAVGLIDSAFQAQENRIGVIITPGRRPAERFQVLRPIHSYGSGVPGGFWVSTPTVDDPSAIDSLVSDEQSVGWQPYRESRFLLGDEACVLFSAPASAFNYRYELPKSISRRANDSEKSTCPELFKTPPCGREHFPFDIGSDCSFQLNLTLRDSVYWRAARIAPDGAPESPAIEASVISGLNQLLMRPSPAEESLEQTIRGNISGRSLKQLLVLTDYLEPLSINMRTALAAAVRGGVRAVFAVFRHPGLSAAEIKELSVRTEEYSSYAQANGGTSGGIEVIESESPDELLLRAGPYMQNLNREIVLKR